MKRAAYLLIQRLATCSIGTGLRKQPLAPPVADGDDEVGLDEDRDVLHHPEPAHPVRERLAHLAHGLPVAGEQQVEHLPPGGVGECPEDGVLGIHAPDYVTIWSHVNGR